jgi:polar amino acid transport system substrate-binding protein
MAMSRGIACITAAVALMVGLSACSSSGSGGSSASAGPTTPAATSGTAAASVTPSDTASVSGAIPSVPADQLISAGSLTACIDPPFEPMQYYVNGNQLTGVDNDLMVGVSKLLKLNFKPIVTDYATVVASLQSGKCDVIVSDQYVTPDRLKQVNMVAYAKANETLIVPSGNPKHVVDKDHLCGLSVAGEAGGLEIDILKAESTTCTKNGQKKIDIQQYAKSPQALQGLLSGHADVWMASQLTALTLKTKQHLNIDLLKPFDTPGTTKGLVAIAFVKSKTALMNAVLAATTAMSKDGSYAAIFNKYQVPDIMVNPAYQVTP